MALTSAQVAVTATPAALNTANPTSSTLLYLKASTTGTFIGPSGVSVSTGLELPSGTSAPVAIELDAGDVMFGVHATSATVQIVRTT